MGTPLLRCLDCGALSKRSRCPEHEKLRQDRHNASRVYYRSAHWRKLRKLAKAVFGDECAVCGSTDRITIHHLDPRPKVPYPTEADNLPNLIALCHRCHNQYEADLRNGTATRLRMIVESLK